MKRITSDDSNTISIRGLRGLEGFAGFSDDVRRDDDTVVSCDSDEEEDKTRRSVHKGLLTIHYKELVINTDSRSKRKTYDSCSFFSTLPYDILYTLLTRVLDSSTMIILQYVCKWFCKTISIIFDDFDILNSPFSGDVVSMAAFYGYKNIIFWCKSLKENKTSEQCDDILDYALRVKVECVDTKGENDQLIFSSEKTKQDKLEVAEWIEPFVTDRDSRLRTTIIEHNFEGSVWCIKNNVGSVTGDIYLWIASVGNLKILRWILDPIDAWDLDTPCLAEVNRGYRISYLMTLISNDLINCMLKLCIYKGYVHIIDYLFKYRLDLSVDRFSSMGNFKEHGPQGIIYGYLMRSKSMLHYTLKFNIAKFIKTSAKHSLDAVEWFLNWSLTRWIEFPAVQQVKMFSNAAKHGHVDILECLYNHGLRGYNVDTFCGVAISCKKSDLVFAVLKWGREHGCSFDKSIVGYAISKKDIKLVEWLIENGCPFFVQDGMFLIHNFEPDSNVMKIIHQTKCPWQNYVDAHLIIGVEKRDYYKCTCFEVKKKEKKDDDEVKE